MSTGPFSFLRWSSTVVVFGVLFLSTTPVHAMAVPTISKVAVIGATGGLGRRAVQHLLDKGIECRILSRRPIDASIEAPASLDACKDSQQVVAYFNAQPKVTVVQGDVGSVEALQELTTGCQACLGLWGAMRSSKVSDLFCDYSKVEADPSHSKQVNYQGVINLMEACRATNCLRIVRITGKGENPTSIISILLNMLGSMAKAWNYEGEQALRGQSDIEYTILRPGLMGDDGSVPSDNNPILQLADNGRDLPVAKIRYLDVAQLAVDCLDYPNSVRSTLTAMTSKDETASKGEATWGPMLAKVQSDRRVFPSDMLERHYAAVKNALFKVGGISVVVVAILAKLLFF